MMGNRHWSRRTFLSAVGISGASALASAYLPHAAESNKRTILYAIGNSRDGGGFLRSFEVAGDHIGVLNDVEVDQPAAIVAHPYLPRLYVANDCSSWRHQPRATIECFDIDTETLRLRSVARLPLALSATGPRSLVLSADAQHLLVSAFHGGACNAFALNAAGDLLPHPAAMKETGCGLHAQTQGSAHPHTIVGMLRSGLLIASDYGADRLTTFQVTPSHGLWQFGTVQRVALPPGSAPSLLAVEPRTGLLVTATQRRPALHLHAFAGGAEQALVSIAEHDLPTPVTAMACHPTAGVVYSVGITQDHATMTTWRIDRARGSLASLHTLRLGSAHELPGASILVEEDRRLWLASPGACWRSRLLEEAASPRHRSCGSHAKACEPCTLASCTAATDLTQSLTLPGLCAPALFILTLATSWNVSFTNASYHPANLSAVAGKLLLGGG
ncbi:beta-propeller fold lactonase family protein [Acidipila sp. EB88]|uniref:lactonase family protein n=1 Tax=Acidipila sp. EB88 TaxID=2305226 RepID=UPI000F5FC70E|nr:beta-propeller fold lactonase family protein [Acidipila sp. EB88]RRA50266.1 twin-arginine translocation signal domain-containing protein [Acidipila sp. EB88]